ncbi:hypothetical protein ACIRD8_22020 [Streptomyces sp. NPDC102451]|uniref:hypothetical protein n=1 Tax=Streptomyces sp. NPDC102451 TaxID=3366177 RepID=UPI0037FB63F0
MATHATMPVRRRTHARAPAPAQQEHRHTALAWAVPLVLGVILGFWAFFINRDGGATTSGQIWLGVVSGVAFAALCYLLAQVRWSLPRELRATAFGVLAGGAVGFLSSLNGRSVLMSGFIGLVVGAGTLATMFYAYYTREGDPRQQGERVGPEVTPNGREADTANGRVPGCRGPARSRAYRPLSRGRR